MDLSPNGSHVVTGSEHGMLAVYDRRMLTSRLTSTCPPHVGMAGLLPVERYAPPYMRQRPVLPLHQVTCCKFSHDAAHLLGIYSWGKLHVFDRPEGHGATASANDPRPASRAQLLARAIGMTSRPTSQSDSQGFSSTRAMGHSSSTVPSLPR